MNAQSIPFLTDDTATVRDTLAGQLALVGKQMIKLADEVSPLGRADDGPEAAPDDHEAENVMLGLLADEVYRDRRRRARYLPSRMLGEPAWDIMLALFIAEARGDDITVSNACLAADAPASTALRWLHNLVEDGLVDRLPDAGDARRHFVRLSGTGLARMTAYFSECREGQVSQKAPAPTPGGERWATAAE